MTDRAEDAPKLIHLFEQPCPAGWVYPCTLGDISARLETLLQGDWDDLWAVGLVPSTRKDQSANGRYFRAPHPAIHLYSYPESLSFKLPAGTKDSTAANGLARERDYGMTLRRDGSRLSCVWDAADLRRFVLCHVLLHEIGHHVYHKERAKRGYEYRPFTAESEQFAEAYAVRHGAEAM